VPDATGPAVEVPTGERVVTVKSGVVGEVEMDVDTGAGAGAGTAGVGKRSIDEEGDEQERYAKRARESVEVGLSVLVFFVAWSGSVFFVG
jgi:hypothetical protein